MMKFLALVAFFAVANSQTTGPGVSDPRCPPNATPNPPLHLNDPSDCRNFFTCVNGLAMPQQCPEGQHWSVTGGFCDWPDRAGCEGGNGNGGCPPGNPIPPVYLPNPDDCGSFFKCAWGVPSPISCPPGQHWSVSNNWCDWPDRANCTAGTTTDSSNDTTTSGNRTTTETSTSGRTTTSR